MPLLFPKFTYQPDFSVPPVDGMLDGRDPVEFSQARRRLIFPWVNGLKTWKFTVSTDSRSEQNSLQQFCSDVGGRHAPFYLPSWQRDVEVAESHSTGDIDIEITESAAGYESDYLTDDREDTVGRVLAFWMPGQTVHISRVVRVLASTTVGQEILELEEALPFDFVPARGVCGFAYIARFSSDEFRWQFSAADVASVDLEFRQLRQWVDLDLSSTLAQYAALATGNEEPPETNTQTVSTTYPYLHTKTAYAEGPDVFQTTQDGVFRQPWAFWLGTDGIRYRKLTSDAEVGQIWPPNDGEGTLSTILGAAPDTSHISAAFDQDGYEAIAWEDTSTTFKLQKFVSTVSTEFGSFTGYSPVLFYTGLTFPTTTPGADCDILCLYLKKGSSVIYCRIQRENFATEHEWWLSPAKFLRLLRCERDGRYMKLVGIDDGLRLTEHLSEQYPPEPFVEVDVGDSAGSGLTVTGGTTTLFLVDEVGAAVASGGGVSIQSGALLNPTISESSPADPAGGGVSIQSGELFSVLVAQSATENTGSGQMGLQTGDLYLTVKNPAENISDAGGGSLAHQESLYFQSIPADSPSESEPNISSITIQSGSFDAVAP